MRFQVTVSDDLGKIIQEQAKKCGVSASAIFAIGTRFYIDYSNAMQGFNTIAKQLESTNEKKG